MRCIIGEQHRQAIIARLPPGGRMLEWGAGGSTLWFADHLPPGATLTSVEHNAEWTGKVAEALGPRANVRLLLREATGPLGRNATIEEEHAAPLANFIHAVDNQHFDVIVVDGYARGACLRRARHLLAPRGTVFLHDAQRPWYDEAKLQCVEHGVIGSCRDYPIPHLWFGGLTPPVPTAGPAPVVVSYFTRATPYEDLAARLRLSCDALGLEHRIAALDSTGTWEGNCASKASVCLQAWQELGQPILWVDADAVVRAPIDFVSGLDADIAVHKWDGWQFASGTIFFGQSPLAGLLLERWAARCQAEPRVWDQEHLGFAWEEVSATHPLRTRWLPRSYCHIFDRPGEDDDAPVIEHFQASRTLKALVTSGDVMPHPLPSEALKRARRASRPMRRWLPGPDSQDFAAEMASEEAMHAA